MTEVIMPKMGDGMEEGTLLEWTKKEGDKVKSGEVIGQIQTDKATLELEAPSSGILSGFLIKGGDTVPVGKAIAALLKEGEKLPESWGGASTAAPEEVQVVAAVEEPELVAAAPVAATSLATDSRIKSSPLARRIAAEKGLDLAAIAGSGPGGRIVERDVVSATPTSKVAAAVLPSLVASAEDSKVSLNKIRQVTAKRTQESKQQAPHFYVTVEVDLERIGSLREQFEADGSGKVSINDFVVKACALALQEMPIVNSSYQGDHLLQHGAVNIGMAVALDDGLTLPVIRNANALSLRQISGTSKDLAKRARENKLSLDELSGSTFSISNMGMLDVDNFIAIINQPNAGILAVSSAGKKVVVNAEDELEVRTRMNISCSFDHRVVDGAVGAKFINLVRDYLENPTRLLA